MEVGVSTAAYLARRAISAVIVLIAVSMLCFALLESAPGDPARSVLEARSGGRVVSDTAIEAQRVSMGLDAPVTERYASWAQSALQGDLGTSYITGRPIVDELGSAVGWTLVLAAVATVFSVVGALIVGLLAAVTTSAWLRRGIETVMFALAGMPGFVTALVLLYIFAARLQVLPSGGLGTPWPTGDLGGHRHSCGPSRRSPRLRAPLRGLRATGPGWGRVDGVGCAHRKCPGPRRPHGDHRPAPPASPRADTFRHETGCRHRWSLGRGLRH